ncbi:HAD family hydrolase [Sciscionella sediminilitoris]|uniref:HAD family hydrolase n=1 Tax=Sciscionella sediminilitoris TaxID=1445613 RepID=UPI0004DF6B9D|nr:haloacid dehalogenase-like hydrolase [Sciscionella sp. SE31]
MRLILWDIDQTLLDLTGQGSRWYANALRAVTGAELTHTPEFAGSTERAITTGVLRENGVPPSDELVERMFAALIEEVTAEADRLAELGVALPGTHEVLAALAEEQAVQSLVTGNLRPVAEHKLGAFGLGEHIDISLGGFGDLSTERADLVAAAIRNATHAHGEPDRIVVLGDSPADIAAAHANGVLAVGVATGKFGAAELADADHVLTDLSATEQVVHGLTRGFG